jgi:hypothetical protein
MRKLVLTLLVFIMIFGIFSGALAAEQVKINIDGQSYTPELGVVNKNGTLLVPLRSFSEALYATVEWNVETKTASISKDGKSVKFKLNEKVVAMGEGSVTLQEPAQLIHGSVYVPLRAAAEALEAQVSWDAINKVTVIESTEYLYLPELVQQTMDKMLELDSYDYTASVAVESGGIYAKGEVFGTYQKDAQFTMNLESAFMTFEAIVDGDTGYYRTGMEELYYKESFVDLPAVSHPVDSVAMLKEVLTNLKVSPHRDATSGIVSKEISFDIDKDKLLQFIAKNLTTEEEFEAELKELVETEPQLKHIFETLNIHVSLLLDDQNLVTDNEIVVSFETDSYGAGKMMEVKLAFNLSYSNFNQGQPITIPTEEQIYDPFDDMLYWNLDSVRDSVLTYHLVEGEYPTATGKADAMVDFTKLTAFQEEISASEEAYTTLWETYDEAYENGDIESEFYVDMLNTVPTSSYYINAETVNLEAHKKAVMYYVDADGEVGFKMQTKPGTGEFVEETTYLSDLDW